MTGEVPRDVSAEMRVRDRGPFPARPALSEKEVHVLHFTFASVRETGAALGLLDDRERLRAARFLRERDRTAFVAAHAATRIVLGRCLKISPESVRFTYGQYGKPGLAEAAIDLRFNLAHVEDRGMLSVSVARAVGVDIESVLPIEVLDVARHFFSPHEVRALRSTAPDDRLAAFYRCWTRKESFLKARGDGLSFPLAVFDVSIEEYAPGTPDASLLLACRDAPEELSRWTTIGLRCEAGYAAALTVEGRGWHLVEWDGF
jgi:4'-phosphopantetheinyl transferase